QKKDTSNQKAEKNTASVATEEKAEESETVIERQDETSGIPLAASVSVLETGRSVNTNPTDGTYSFVHAAGEFTVVAERYGFHPNEKTVNIEENETAEADFTLEEMDQYTVSGTVTSENT